MAFAQGSRSGLSFIEEVTFGTTPAGDFTALPFTTNSLAVTKDRVQGQDIRPDRMPRVDRHGNKQAGGDVVVDLRDGVYDSLLESAMFSDFSGTDISVGTTPKYFTIEDAAQDIGQYRLYTGQAVSSMSISIAPNQMVTTTFTMVGKGGTISQVGKTVGTFTDAEPFDAYSGDIQLGDSGGALSTVNTVSAIDFTVDNSLAPTFVVGSDTTPQLEYGRAEVTGTAVFYFEDEAIIERFLNETETAFSVTVDDPSGTNAYIFDFPKVKINSATVPVDNPQSRMVTCEFVALYDDVAGTNFSITRPTPA
jgi:hypothetical protein